MSRSIRRTSLVLLSLLAMLAIITGYWQAVQGQLLAAREDNPRLALAEQQIPRGAILDRDGRPLAVSQGTSNGYVRYYPERAAAPVVGYYSLRHGVGGAEAAFDAELRGTAGRTLQAAFVDNLLHRVPKGRSVRLTLNLPVQKAADAALGDHSGAVVVLSVPDGQVLALASRPTFDPATLDENWDRLRTDPSSPLLNRATQGSYQPGATFQFPVLTEALPRGLAHLTDTIQSADVPVPIDGAFVHCAISPTDRTLGAAFAAGCPAPFAMLADSLDAASLADVIHRWNFVPSRFELPVYVSDFAPGSLTTGQMLRDLILGQGSFTTSPLQMAIVVGTLINNGQPIASPHLLLAGSVSPSSTAVVPPEIANAIQTALLEYGTRNDLVGQVALAIGGEKQYTWFVGYASATKPRWAIVVLLENGDAATSREIAAQIRTALGP